MTGETSAAVAGGANVMLTPQTSARICLLQALSPVGRCKTFEASGDGYGRGEAFTVAYMRCPATLTAQLFRPASYQDCLQPSRRRHLNFSGHWQNCAAVSILTDNLIVCISHQD